MEHGQGSSSALVRKRQDTDLMPPPPQVKKIKRPKKVLDEDSYTEALSQIIARDFFPGLLETQTKQEYLDALESKDTAWISSASRRLRQVMTPGRKTRSTPLRTSFDGSRTPTTYVGDTPASVASTVPEQEEPKLDISMSLSKFQETYTSEDNESFYKLVDKQNQKKADKYAWLWRGNKMPSKQMIAQKAVTDRLSAEGRLIDDGHKRDRLAIKDADERPARPDAWRTNPRNGLMFAPEGLDDGVVSIAQQAEDSSKGGAKSIVYANTRMMEPPAHPKRPSSPTMSSVRDAIAGRPRQQDQDSSVTGSETPRVNGYAFVDDEDDEELPEPEPVIDLGPGDAHNPFKVQDQRSRESLHERMVEKIARSKKESSRSGFTGKAERLEVPKFPSSPRVTGNLTPAAQRLWSKMGTPRGQTPGDSFGQSTPLRSRGSLLKGKLTPKHK
ncbi:hypothetical protein Golomagni_05650 [Golovinomyces magnicellulatus]|nr:hypothetical protein Golomagni_05650 [Golovinomyces magnicellulatus]